MMVLAVASLCIFVGTEKPVSAATMRQPINYQQPSETGAYPNPDQYQNLNVLVKVSQNRVYIRDGHRVLYKMYCSAGVKDPKTGKTTTPTGSFKIQPEHGQSFYNQSLKEGANYWTSFKNHGEYLFHTVPTDAEGHYKPQEAAKLGKSTGSHGCIRLSIPDAKYMQTLPVGTPVKIEP